MSDDVAVKDEKEKVKPTTVDLNDLSLVDEISDINPDRDAFAGPPPPDDGDHLVKLSLGKAGVTTGTVDKKGAMYGKTWYQVDITGKIQAGDAFEGRQTFRRVGTMVFDGTSEVIGVLKALGEPVTVRESTLDLLRRLKGRLDGEPECIQKTQWVAYCKDCGDEYETTRGARGKKKGIVLRGQNRFPQGAEGKHNHMLECPNCGSMLTARAEVVAFKPAPTS